MLTDLQLFFADYPVQILQFLRAKPAGPDLDLTSRLTEYRERSLHNLEIAQYFRIANDAGDLLFRLTKEIKEDGLDDILTQTELPFPVMIIEHTDPASSLQCCGMITQVDGLIQTQRFIVGKTGLIPPSIAITFNGASGEVSDTPTHELFAKYGEGFPAQVQSEEIEWNKYMLALAVSLAILLRYDGMLKQEQVSLHPRQSRKEAAKAGRELPNLLISRISLGKAGRGQHEAMKEGAVRGETESNARRAHWVRGHFMRSPRGMVWRMPHLRGAGPIVRQERRVVL